MAWEVYAARVLGAWGSEPDSIEAEEERRQKTEDEQRGLKNEGGVVCSRSSKTQQCAQTCLKIAVIPKMISKSM